MSKIPAWGYDLIQSLDLPDFVFIPEYQQLRKGDDRNWQNLIFGFSSYQDVDLLELSFGTRIAIVEDLIAPFLDGFSHYHRYSNTVTSNLSKFYEQRALRLKFRRGDDLGQIKKQIEDFYYRDGGREFLERYSDLREVEKALNLNPHKPSALSFNPALRAYRGLALASLLGKQDLSLLFENHMQAMRRSAVPAKQEAGFKKLAESLATWQN